MPDQSATKDQLRQTLDAFSAAAAAIDSLAIRDATTDGDVAVVILEVDTTIYSVDASGLPVKPREYVTLRVGSDFPWIPPTAFVTHWRWIGFPHVLGGTVLCLYLDPSTQWDPTHGAVGYLARLSDWFAEAIAGEFDAKTALFHAVGGVPHRSPGAPTIVVEEQLSFEDERPHWRRIVLQARSQHRIDAVAWHGKGQALNTRTGLLVVLPGMLPFGAGSRLSDLTSIVGLQQSHGARKRLLKKLRQTLKSLGPSDPLQIIIAVPNPANEGPGRFHLIACHIDSEQIQHCMTAATKRRPEDPPSSDEPEVVWLYVDDQRPGLSTRRDADQPLQHFQGKSVELWGCGGLGSWVAEYLVRAGISQITLRDPGYVTQGLLVRQNYTELDVGRPKVEALADRLRSIDGKLDVRPTYGICERALAESLNCDVVIDATVSTSVATAIEIAQKDGSLQAPLVQIATDNETASLGILTVCQPQSGYTTNDIDYAARERAESESGLAPFLEFWNERPPPLTPTLGCSVPTFRGSAADLSAIASAGLNLAAHALGRTLSGGYLFASPHSPHHVPPVIAVNSNSRTNRNDEEPST